MKDKIINILGTALDADQQTLENIADEILLLFDVSGSLLSDQMKSGELDPYSPHAKWVKGQ